MHYFTLRIKYIYWNIKKFYVVVLCLFTILEVWKNWRLNYFYHMWYFCMNNCWAILAASSFSLKKTQNRFCCICENYPFTLSPFIKNGRCLFFCNPYQSNVFYYPYYWVYQIVFILFVVRLSFCYLRLRVAFKIRIVPKNQPVLKAIRILSAQCTFPIISFFGQYDIGYDCK